MSFQTPGLRSRRGVSTAGGRAARSHVEDCGPPGVGFPEARARSPRGHHLSAVCAGLLPVTVTVTVLQGRDRGPGGHWAAAPTSHRNVGYILLVSASPGRQETPPPEGRRGRRHRASRWWVRLCGQLLPLHWAPPPACVHCTLPLCRSGAGPCPARVSPSPLGHSPGGGVCTTSLLKQRPGHPAPTSRSHWPYNFDSDSSSWVSPCPLQGANCRASPCPRPAAPQDCPL